MVEVEVRIMAYLYMSAGSYGSYSAGRRPRGRGADSDVLWALQGSLDYA